jgi:hypothetical protein
MSVPQMAHSSCREHWFDPANAIATGLRKKIETERDDAIHDADDPEGL